MVFSSIEFLWLFLPAVVVLYLLAPPRARNALLAGVSIVFYAWGAHSLVLLFIASIALNYVAGLVIAGRQARGDEHGALWAMRIAVALNVAALVFWKYAVFAVEQIASLVGGWGSTGPASPPSRCRWASRSSRSTASATWSTCTAEPRVRCAASPTTASTWPSSRS
jgi:D-alanyl-lipoteichoic acid acyltransferase DltB (MBOAT superfamily)